MAYASVKRGLYPGNRPNWIARALNGLWAALAAAGHAPYSMVTLEVAGRRSGRTITLPVVVALVDGERYLASMLGEDVQWVRNVRAADGKAAIRSGSREAVHLEEVPVERRALILKAYLQRAPGARPHVPVQKDAPLAEFERIAGAYPIFHIVAPMPGGPQRKT